MSYFPAADVAYVEDPRRPDTVYVAKVPDGEPLILQGPAAMIWLAALDEAHPADSHAVTALVAAWTEVSEGELRADIESFLAQLIGSELLEVR